MTTDTETAKLKDIEILATALKNADIDYIQFAEEWGIWCGDRIHADAILNAAKAHLAQTERAGGLPFDQKESDARIKKFMQHIGFPDSITIYTQAKQLENEIRHSIKLGLETIPPPDDLSQPSPLTQDKQVITGVMALKLTQPGLFHPQPATAPAKPDNDAMPDVIYVGSFIDFDGHEIRFWHGIDEKVRGEMHEYVRKDRTAAQVDVDEFANFLRQTPMPPTIGYGELAERITNNYTLTKKED